MHDSLAMNIGPRVAPPPYPTGASVPGDSPDDTGAGITRLSPAIANTYVATRRHQLAADGLGLFMSRDMHHLKALHARFPDTREPVYSPLFDPDRHPLPEGEAFWIGIDRDGAIVACEAIRLVRPPADEVARQLWGVNEQAGSQPLVIDGGPLQTFGPYTSYSGAAWVSPAWRGRGLTGVTDWSLRVIARSLWGMRLHWGFVHADLAARGVIRSLRHYGFSQGAPALRLGDRLYQAGWITAEEIDTAILERVPERVDLDYAIAAE